MNGYLCALSYSLLFLLTNKVYSPQYNLWILPFFVLLRVPIWLWIAFCVFDLVGFVAFFRSVVPGPFGGQLAEHLLVVSVWGRAAVLVLLGALALRLAARGSYGEARD